MNNKLDQTIEEQNHEYLEKGRKDLDFSCPHCGEISQDDVIFLCNTCDHSQMIEKHGNFFCPQCFSEIKEKFMCRLCDNRMVKIRGRI